MFADFEFSSVGSKRAPAVNIEQLEQDINSDIALEEEDTQVSNKIDLTIL